KNTWPEWIPREGGAWERRWCFEFESSVPADHVSSEGMSEPELEVVVEPAASPHRLTVTTTTRANAWSDDVFFFAAYRLFERLERRFGRLKTIHGQPRALWRPFR